METVLGFSVDSSAFELDITVPHWFVLSLLGIIATFGRPPWRFSLRTLLIITTLVAIALGLIVTASRFAAAMACECRANRYKVLSQ